MEKVIDRISTSIENSDLKKAKEQLDEGKKILSKRQKLIKIADKGRLGSDKVLRVRYISIRLRR